MSTLSEPPSYTGTLPQKKPLWRNRDYLLLISGQAVSAVGSQVSLIAFPLLIYALTNSPAQTGLMTALRSLPFVLFTLPAGAVVDRWDRKRLMIYCDIGRAIAMGSIPLALLFGQITYTQLYIVSLVEGTLLVFFNLAELAALPRVVAAEQVASASSQNEVLTSVASMIGPALGPILYGLGRMLPFFLDAVSYAISALSLCFIRTRFQTERVVEERMNMGREIKEGIVWLWSNPLLRFLALLTFGLITPCYGYVLVFIVLAQNLHATDLELGLIFASGGVGSVVGALIASPLYHRFGFSKVLIISAWIWALSWLFYAFAPTLPWLMVINAIGFIIVPIYMVVLYSYRANIIPDHLQGRVNSVFRLLAFSGQPIGIALTGFLLQVVGPFYTIVLLFIPQGLLCVIATVNKHVRHAG